MEPWQALSGKDFSRWIDAYNQASLHTPGDTTALSELLVEADWIVCSSLRRSLDSAALLNLQPSVVDQSFREAELPVVAWRWPRLKPQVWLLLNRTLWFLGLRHNVESFAEMKQRAYIAAASLMSYAADNRQVVLVGHGLFNQFVARALLAKGMQGPRKTASRYWGISVYEK